MIDIGQVIAAAAGIAVIGTYFMTKVTTAQRQVAVMLKESAMQFPDESPYDPPEPTQDAPDWIWRRCAKCGNASPGKALCCASDGGAMELCDVPPDNTLVMRIEALELRTMVLLSEREAVDVLQLEDVHDITFGEELYDFVRLRRLYCAAVWPEYSDKTTLN